MSKPGVNFNAIGFHKKHGHMPQGRAIWIFYFSDSPEEPWVPGQSKNNMLRLGYLEAKRLATAEAQLRQVTSVRVDPEPL